MTPYDAMIDHLVNLLSGKGWKWRSLICKARGHRWEAHRLEAIGCDYDFCTYCHKVET